MGNAFRNQPAPTVYSSHKTPFTVDYLEVGISVACAMPLFSFILILPGIRGWERLWATVRFLVALWIGIVLLQANLGKAWLTDHITGIHTQYKAFTNKEIVADIGIDIGLRGINVTLLGVPEYQNRERINYVESFRWSDPWDQGHLGFGPFAGRFNQDYRAAQFRGVPYPIQWIAEYFTLDGEQIRWGRKFRMAGWFAHILLWFAFAVYLLTIILFWLVIRLGAIAMIYLGVIMILTVFLYGAIIMNDPELKIPFGHEDNQILRPRFDWAFYITLLTGIGCVILGCVIWILNYFVPQKIAIVFSRVVAEEDDIIHEDEPESEHLLSEECNMPTHSSKKSTQWGITRFRQIQRLPHSSSHSHLGSQHLNSKSDIPLGDVSQGPITITVSTIT